MRLIKGLKQELLPGAKPYDCHEVKTMDQLVKDHFNYVYQKHNKAMYRVCKELKISAGTGYRILKKILKETNNEKNS